MTKKLNLFKKTTLITFLVNSYLMGMEPAPIHYTPHNTKIMWDFHRVIVNYDTKEIMHQSWQHLDNLKTLIHPFVLYQFMKGFYTRGTGGEWGTIIEEYPELAQSLMNIGNSVKPIEGTHKILLKLHQLGYEQDLASDINTQLLQALEQNSSVQNILPLFSNKKTVDSDQPNAIFKYDKRYFIDYQQEYNKKRKHLIFIDDCPTNIESAKTVGITGIVFKNPTQLHRDLEKLGIFISSS